MRGGRRHLLNLHPLSSLATTTAHLDRRLAAIATVLAVRSRIRRGCDRQRGDAGCKKDPGHKISPLNGKTVRSSHRSNY